MKKILIISMNPIARPIHGGQKRTRAIYDAYQKTPGINVKFCSIHLSTHYKECWKDDIKIPKKYYGLMNAHPLTGDIITGNLLYNEEDVASKVHKLITTYQPDVIEVEHPFFFPGLLKLLQRVGYKPKLVYSSHNIEYIMKEEMLLGEGMSNDEASTIKEEVLKMEVSAIDSADLIISVSKSDKEKMVQMGAIKSKVVVARNGIELEEPTVIELNFWDEHLRSKGVDKFIVFIGSAHPPNWTGFQKMIGHKIGFLKPNERIILAGSISDYFQNEIYNKDNPNSVVFWKRVLPVGVLSDERLSALISKATGIVLPIVEGGGSNLKTAEALLSQKPIICTSYAMRSFEEFSDYPNIYVSDKPGKFIENIENIIREPKITKLTSTQKAQLRRVTWDSCLKNTILKIIEL